MAGLGARTGDSGATPPAAAASGQILCKQQTPPKMIGRHLAFASMKPPFVLPDDYHRFSTPARAAADHPPEAIIVKSTVRPVLSLVLFPISIGVCLLSSVSSFGLFLSY